MNPAFTVVPRGYDRGQTSRERSSAASRRARTTSSPTGSRPRSACSSTTRPRPSSAGWPPSSPP